VVGGRFDAGYSSSGRALPLSAGAFCAALLMVLVSVPASGPAFAQDVEPFTGRLLLQVEDLRTPVGAVALAQVRVWTGDPQQGGLLGPGWRCTWDVEAVLADNMVVVRDGARAIAFQPAGASGRFASAQQEEFLLAKDGAGTWTKSDGTKDRFDARGRLRERDLRNGNRLRLQYDTRGRLARIDGPRKSGFVLESDEAGHLVALTDHEGRRCTYAYSNGLLQEVALDGVDLARYGYDRQGLLVRIDVPGRVYLTYDAQGRVASRSTPGGGTERCEYGADGRSFTVGLPGGGSSTTTRSADGLREETVDAAGGRTVSVLDGAGRPVSITSPGGSVLKLAYDARGRLERVEESGGRVTTYAYLGATMLRTRVATPDGRVEETRYDAELNPVELRRDGRVAARFTYLPDGLLKTAQEEGGPVRQFEYDESGRLRVFRAAPGREFRTEYDERGRRVRLTDPAGGTASWTYDEKGRLASAADSTGAATRYAYDAAGGLAAVTDPEGTTTRIERDAAGRVTALTSPDGAMTRYQHDAAGRLVKVRHPDGAEETFTFDAAGRLIARTEYTGAAWTYSYDALGRVAGVSGPLGYRETKSYDAEGRLAATTDALGRKTEYCYGADGQLAEVRGPGGQKQKMEFDAAGRLQAVTGQDGQRLAYTYDAQGRLVGVARDGDALLKFQQEKGRVTGTTGPDGATASYTYDADGNRAGVTYGNGESFRYRCDAMGRTESAVDGLGREWKMAYTAQGRLVGLTLPDGSRFQYRYIPSGRLDAIEDPLGRMRTFEYDAQARLRRQVDALGRGVVMYYDAGDRLVATENPGGARSEITYDALGRVSRVKSSQAPEKTYAYDAAGRLLTEFHGDTSADYAYDEQDRLTEARYRPAAAAVRHTYDGRGRRSGIEIEGVGTWAYSYDARGRLVGVTGPAGGEIRLAYDAAGRLTGKTLPNGVAMTRSYDARGRVVSVEARGPAGVLLRRAYAYDKSGNISKETREDGSAWSYTYDRQNRLVKREGGKRTETFAYDAVGNRLLSDGRAEYDAGDQVVRFGDETFTHDAQGRIVGRARGGGAVAYTYGSGGDIRAVRRDGRIVAEYGYDAQGRRAWKRVDGRTTHFVYDDQQVLVERDDAGKAARVWIPGPELDQPLGYIEGGEVFYPLADVRASVVALTDRSGASRGAWSYTPFGELEGASSAPPPLGYVGREYDAESGLYFMRARYYDPALGRFVSPDPVMGDLNNPASLHAYQYAYNNPLRFRDPTGAWAPSDIANAVDGAAPGIGETVGRGLTRAGLTVVSGGVRIINAFRGEEGRRSNERLDRAIDSGSEQGAIVGDGLASTAGQLVSDPLRLGQSAGEYTAATTDQGREGTWGQAGLVTLTEVGRAAALAGPISRVVTPVVKGGARGITGALETYGRANRAVVPTPDMRRVLMQGADAVQQGGLTAIHPKWVGTAFEGELWAHEGLHALLSNTATKMDDFLRGLTGMTGTPIANLRDSILSGRWGVTIEESATWAIQNLYGQSRGIASLHPQLGSLIGQTGNVLGGYMNAFGGASLVQQLVNQLGVKPGQYTAQGIAAILGQRWLQPAQQAVNAAALAQEQARFDQTMAWLQGQIASLRGVQGQALAAIKDAQARAKPAGGADAILPAVQAAVASVKSAAALCTDAANVPGIVSQGLADATRYKGMIDQGIPFARGKAETCASAADGKAARDMYDNVKGLADGMQRMVTRGRAAQTKLNAALQAAAAAKQAHTAQAGAPGKLADMAKALDTAVVAVDSKLGVVKTLRTQLETDRTDLLRNIQAVAATFMTTPKDFRNPIAALAGTVTGIVAPDPGDLAAPLEAEADRVRGLSTTAQTALDSVDASALCSGLTAVDDDISQIEALASAATSALAGASDIPSLASACEQQHSNTGGGSGWSSGPGDPGGGTGDVTQAGNLQTNAAVGGPTGAQGPGAGSGSNSVAVGGGAIGGDLPGQEQSNRTSHIGRPGDHTGRPQSGMGTGDVPDPGAMLTNATGQIAGAAQAAGQAVDVFTDDPDDHGGGGSGGAGTTNRPGGTGTAGSGKPPSSGGGGGTGKPPTAGGGGGGGGSGGGTNAPAGGGGTGTGGTVVVTGTGTAGGTSGASGSGSGGYAAGPQDQVIDGSAQLAGRAVTGVKVTVNYDAISIPDQFQVVYQGATLADSGMVSYGGQIVGQGAGSSPQVTIRVISSPDQSTVWNWSASVEYFVK
jgi:RHS repeat-associated protein